jgi:hypothetical protein
MQVWDRHPLAAASPDMLAVVLAAHHGHPMRLLDGEPLREQ